MVKLLGINNDVTTCECCGKTNLKRTAVLELPDGSIVHYGRDCAARKLGKSVGKDIDLLTAIAAYVAKYPQVAPEKMERAIWKKFGAYAQHKDGRFHIHRVGII